MIMKLLIRLSLAVTLLSPAVMWAQSPAQPPEYQPQTQSPQGKIQAQQQREVTQPGNNAPVWRNVQAGVPNFTTVQGREAEVLIQPPARFPGQETISTAGEAWRLFRNGPVTFCGGWLVVLTLIAILGFYVWKGPVKVHEPPTGRLIHRFSVVERAVHWSTAVSFCVLGLTGLIMFFGKHVLLPLLGYTLFAWLATAAKAFHNFIAPLFIVSVVAMVVLFIKDNFPRLRPKVVRPRLGGHGARRARADGPVQCRRKGMVLVRRGGTFHRRELERACVAVPELRPDARRNAGCLGGTRNGGARLHRHLARPHLPRNHWPGRLLPGDALRLRRRGLGEGAPRVLV